MLLLSRKAGAALVIGDDVTVTVVGIEGGRVVLGVQAPGAVAVVRDDARRVPGQVVAGCSNSHGSCTGREAASRNATSRKRL